MFLKEAVERGLLWTADASSAAGHSGEAASRVPNTRARGSAYLWILAWRKVASFRRPTRSNDRSRPCKGPVEPAESFVVEADLVEVGACAGPQAVVSHAGGAWS